MKNKEKFTNELVEIALSNVGLAVNRDTGIPIKCTFIGCDDCLFKGNCISVAKNAWGESEWKEPITAESLAQEFSKYHGSIRPDYILAFANWIFNRYTLIEKESKNEE